MFEHSVKVPRHYKAAANILKKVCTEGGSIKTLIYDAKYRHFNVNSLYALVTTAVRNARALTSLFKDIELLEREPRLDQWLARILAIEILMGKKSLPGNSKPEQTLLSYKEQIEYFPTKHPELFDFKGPCRPRYVRVNTIKMSIEEFIIRFNREGYRFIPCTKGSYDDFLDQVRNIEEGDFIQDYHVKCMFAFHTTSKFHDHELRLDGRILLQDKASALAVELLAPETGASILDMCAAPGMKTTQAAAYVNNSSTMYAIEINPARHEVLDRLVKLAGANRVNVILGDVFEVDTHSMSDVEYILLDPSCSGSGMDYNLGDYTKEEEEWKLEKLTALQEKLLRYAMTSFPRAKRIVYSTCSLLPEENERVIMNVLNNSRRKWQVQCAKSLLQGQWKNFGQGKPGSIPRKCLYAKPDSDLTKGFFLAVLERNPDDLSKGISNLNSEYELQIDRESNAIRGAEEVKERKQSAIFANQEIYKHNENSEYHNGQDEPKKESKKKRNKKEYDEAEYTYSNNDNDSLKANRKMKIYGESLDNITNNLSGLVVAEESPKKTKKLTDPLQNKEIELNSSREELSKKKKRRKDMDEKEMSEETQLGSKSELRNSKKKKHKKYEYCDEEDETNTESKNQIKDRLKSEGTGSVDEIVFVKSNRKIKSNSLNNITDDLNGLVMVEDIPKKRKKINDPIHFESQTSHADFSANDMEYDVKVSKKKKRRKDKDVKYIELEETQEISKSESKSNKKDKHKTNDVDLSEGNKKKRREHMDIDEETEETHLRSKSESGKSKKKKRKKNEINVPEELCIEDA